MAKAFVLVNASTRHDIDSVAETLRSVEGVKHVYQVYGAYDLVVDIQAESEGKVKSYITSGIRDVDGITSTLSMIVADDLTYKPASKP